MLQPQQQPTFKTGVVARKESNSHQGPPAKKVKMAQLNLPYNPEELREPDPELLELLNEAAPSINIVKIPVDNLTLREIISHQSNLRQALGKIEKGIKLLENENHLLTRILYKDKNKYRNDHGFKTMQMLRKSVEKASSNYPKAYLENLVSWLPQVVYSTVHLPPASLAEYAGLRTWLACHSLERVLHCCHLIAVHASCRVVLSHEVHAALLRLSIAGRMWAISIHTKKYVDEAMQSLAGCSNNIPIGRNFYSKELVAKIFKGYSTKKIASIPTASALADTSMTFDLGEKVSRSFIIDEKLRRQTVINEFSNPEISICYEKKKSNGLSLNPKGNISNNTETKKKPDFDLSVLSNLKSLEDFKSFLDSENARRKVNRKESLTRRLPQDKWKALKREVSSSFKPNLPKKSAKLCRKLIRQALS
jgi:hypothetical protein